MRVYFGQGAQVSAGVYGGGVAASAAYAGEVQVHPEGEEALTLDVLATTTGSAQAYRLLKWWHDNYITGSWVGDLQPLFHVPWTDGEDSGRFVASGFELVAVTPTMVYVRLALALPDGVQMEDVRAALEAGERVNLYFRGETVWVVARPLDKGQAAGWVSEFDGALFLGSTGDGGSSLMLDATGVSNGVTTSANVSLDGVRVLGVKTPPVRDGYTAFWQDNGEVQRLTVVESASVCDVGRIRIEVRGKMLQPWAGGGKGFSPCFSLACRASGLAATHDAIPLELA